MREELDKLLCEKYPEIFRDRNAPITETCMCWGFDCNDGWFNIIDALCFNITAYVKQHNENVVRHIAYHKMRDAALSGDWSLFNEDFDRLYPKKLISEHFTEEKREEIRNGQMKALVGDIPEWFKNTEPMEYPVATQVKEKFGTLRFYYNGGNSYIDGLERMAESMSGRTCEDCGSPGKLRTGGWLRTLCDTHASEKGYHIKETEEPEF